MTTETTTAAPPRWDADAGAWMCSDCGSLEIQHQEKHWTVRTMAESTADRIAFYGLSECICETSSEESIYCQSCCAEMPLPDVEVDYV